MTAADTLLWERWDEVDHLLNAALDLPAGQREDHLRRQTEHDPPLRDLVLRLLARLEEADDRVSAPPRALMQGAFHLEDGIALEEDLAPGTPVGHYVIRARHARGGMATVYEAERSDGAYQQRVALKVLRRGLDTDDLVRRFKSERQILSSLSHPHIARLLDGGALPDGRPYLVMELVQGEPITEYADRAGLDIPGRLALFLDVASAVHASHRQLVVHRDIKPSNILVDTEGRVKLLDFGIAKLLERDAEETDAGSRALTPDYASPEQLRGDLITTGTDVYQLGLLLRHLLTGLSPRACPAPPGEPPLRASRAAALSPSGQPTPTLRATARKTTAAGLIRTLSGDLDLIVGKAVRVDPDERYASAEELAAEVRRYLQGLPILARPESARYRFRKFTERHPLFLPGALAVVAAVVLFIVVLERQNLQLERERDAAEVSARRAEATQAFLIDILRRPDPTVGTAGQSRDLTVVEALQLGRARVDQELVGQPEVRAALLEAMGRSFSGLGRYETADTLLRQALFLRQEQYGAESASLAPTVAAIGANYNLRREFAPADSFLHTELRLLSLAGPPSDTLIADRLAVLSVIRRNLGDVDSAIALADRAVTLRRTAGDTLGKRFTTTLGALAQVLRGANQLDSARTVYSTLLERQRGDSGTDRLDLASTHNNIGYLLRVREEYPAAETHYREAVRLAIEVLGAGHPSTLIYGSNLAAVLEFAGKIDEAAALARAQVAAVEREWPDGHWRVGAQHMAMGRFLLRNDRAADAIAPLEAGVQSFITTLGAGHTWTAVAAAHHGTALLLAGQPARGRATAHQAFVVLRDHPIALAADSRVQLDQMIAVLREAGESDLADRYQSLLEQVPPS